tara:strand:+ start:264 stop:770 length:507 start_codon:yes stop_codon:yes gene_type:complete
MTSANTLSELFSFEKYFENVALIFLKEDCSVEVFASASLENFVTPRLEISFRAMEATEPSDSPISLGLDEYRKYQANFEVTIITDSSVGGLQTREFHLELVGKVRASLLRTQPNWNATNLPFYGVKLIRQNSFDRTTDGDLELSILNYDLYFSIRDSAFPTTTTTPAP